MKPKVLIITYYWPPSGGSGVQRWVKFVKYLPHFGIEPVMLIPENPTYPATDNSLREDLAEDLNVYKSKSIDPFSVLELLSGKNKSSIAKPSSSLGKTQGITGKIMSWVRANIFIPDARVGWLITARKKAADIAVKHGINTVITTGPPHSVHFTGKYLKEKYGLRWIADFRDPWSQIYYNQLLPKTAPVKKLDLKLEKSVLQTADEVIVISPSMVSRQQDIVDRSYQLITNGFDPDDFPQKSTVTSGQLPFTIRHIGTLSEASVPLVFFRALSHLSDHLEWRSEFIGNIHHRVRELTEEFSLDSNIVFKDYMPHAKAISHMMSSDMLLLVIPRVADNELILTGKLFEYLATGKPILMIGPKNGDAAHIIREAGQGHCFGYDETERLTTFLSRNISDKTSLNPEDTPLLSVSEKHPYSRIRLTEQLAKLINS